MKKEYFAWKDGKQAVDGHQEWIKISKREHRKIYESNKHCAADMRRYFVTLSGVDVGDACYCFECDYEEYKKYRAEKEQRARKAKLARNDETKYGSPRLLSFDAEYSDDLGDLYTLHELVGDESTRFEDDLINSIALKFALGRLTESERQMIYLLFFESDENISEREIADMMEIPQKTLNNRKLKILEKLKKYLAQN